MKMMLDSLKGYALYGAMGVTMVAALTGCPENQGTFTPPPTLKFASVASTAAAAEINETVVVSWEYENENLLVAQRARLISLTFFGLSATEFTELPVNERSLNFQFAGPCMVELVCDDANGVEDTISFEVLTDEKPFMFATVRNGTNGYPRLGATTTRSRTIFFHQFFGAFDPKSNANGRLDDIFALGLPTSTPFRGLSFSPKETENFDFRQGSAYPLLSNLDPLLGVANSVVYAGGFSYDGSVFEVKTDDGLIEGRRLVTTFEAIFMTIVLQTFETIAPVVVDIQLGNVNQGMVASLTNYGMGGRSVNSVNIVPSTNLETNGEITGSIKSAVLGMPVTDAFENIFDAFVEVQNIEFSMPFLRDDDLQSRLF